MTQSPELRRLGRLSASYNRDARSLGNQGVISATDLLHVEQSSDRCAYCEVGLEFGRGTFDHAIALERGGRNVWTNIVRCCSNCQRTKHTKTPTEFAAWRTLTVICPVDGKKFRPRWNDWIAGRGRVCSRSCSAKLRWA